jgi:Toxin SymE, type I toxin-antitoxin system
MIRRQTSDAESPRPADQGRQRMAKVHYLYRGSEARPFLRLSGKWLGQLGFEVGRRFVVEATPGELRIRALPEELPH